MSKFYSPSTRGFYSPDVHEKAQIPPDAVPITDDYWRALLDAEAAGRVIRPGPDGTPVADERNSSERGAALLQLRNEALAGTDWLAVRHRDELDAGRSPTLSTEKYKALQAWRSDLRELPDHPDFPNVQLPARPAGL